MLSCGETRMESSDSLGSGLFVTRKYMKKILKITLIAFGVMTVIALVVSVNEDRASNEILESTPRTENVVEEKPRIIWTVSGPDFDTSSSAVPVWTQPNPNDNGPGTTVGQVNEGDKVVFLASSDTPLPYCQIKTDSFTGWIGCSWLLEAPNELKDPWTF